jgi:ribosomal-protein-alanine N-acetyltransferase
MQQRYQKAWQIHIKRVDSMKAEDIFCDLPVLETERTILRKIKKQDEEDMYSYCSDEEVSRHTTWYKHNTLEDTRMFLNMVLEDYKNQKVAPWGIEERSSGKFIGTCGFVYWDTHHSRAELGYALSRKFWNQGYMSEAIRRIIDFGFTKMDLVRIEARCHPDNIGSARVMEKSDMQFEGILKKHLFTKGSHQDVKMYSIIK